jgi:hypothetical protein
MDGQSQKDSLKKISVADDARKRMPQASSPKTPHSRLPACHDRYSSKYPRQCFKAVKIDTKTVLI